MGQITPELSAVGIARRINMYGIREVLHVIRKFYLIPTLSLVISKKTKQLFLCPLKKSRLGFLFFIFIH